MCSIKHNYVDSLMKRNIWDCVLIKVYLVAEMANEQRLDTVYLFSTGG